jgi:hypothetical protein
MAWRRRLISRSSELACRRVQFASKNPYAARRGQRQRDAIPGNPPDLEYDVIPYVNPFTNFSTKHQHFKTPRLNKPRCTQPGTFPIERCIA